MANSYPPGYTEPTEEETNFWADRAAEKQAFIDEAYQRGRTDALKNQDPDRYDKAWSDGYAEGKAHAIKELMEGEPDMYQARNAKGRNFLLGKAEPRKLYQEVINYLTNQGFVNNAVGEKLYVEEGWQIVPVKIIKMEKV